VAPVIQSATITMDPYRPITPSHGDLWFSTWAANDNLYMTWGDGCGPGFDWDPPLFTDAGISEMTGSIPDLECLPAPGGCIKSRDIPSGLPDTDDKPSSILALGSRLILAGHTPLGEPEEGYLAYSDDFGATWTKVAGSPWVKDPGNRALSPFRCIMFINMGQDYGLNSDGYVYGLGMGWEWDWDIIHSGYVYLTRVPVADILDYSSYTYFSGITGSVPSWSTDQLDAVPVPGLNALSMGSAMYHDGTGRYLFLTAEGLYEAGDPWGPWNMITPLFAWGTQANWKGGYMPGLITKGAGSDFVWFTLAGQDRVVDYTLQLGRIDLTTSKTVDSSHKVISIPASRHSKNSMTGIHVPAAADTKRNRAIINVPGDYGTIQAGVDAAISGDTVLVAAGTYTGLGNRDILIEGAISITLESESGPDDCIIDCEFSGRGFIILNSLDQETVIRGFSVINGYSRGTGGGVQCLEALARFEHCRFNCCGSFSQGSGILCYESDVTFAHCEISNNTTGLFGGGVCALSHSSVVLQNCTLDGNTAGSGGGAIFSDISDIDLIHSVVRQNNSRFGGAIAMLKACHVDLTNSWILDNSAETLGGGVFYDVPFANPAHCDTRSFIIRNCTISGNTALEYGGGFYGERTVETEANIIDSILWGNTAGTGNEIALFGELYSTLNISRSDVQGGHAAVYQGAGWVLNWGTGMISDDPSFVSGPLGDYYLSHTGTGQPGTSPCVDAGSDLSQNVCFDFPDQRGTRCLSSFTTRTDSVYDGGTVDLGAHYPDEKGLYLPTLKIWGILILLIMLSIGVYRK